MPVFSDYKRISPTITLGVAVYQPPDYSEDTAITISQVQQGNSSNITFMLTKQEALEFANSLDTLKSFILGAYGLMDSYAEEFERNMRLAHGAEITGGD